MLVQTMKLCSLSSMLVQFILSFLLQQQVCTLKVQVPYSTISAVHNLRPLQSLPLYDLHCTTISNALRSPLHYDLRCTTISAALRSPPLYDLHCSTISASLWSLLLYHLHRSTISTALWSLPLYNLRHSMTAAEIKEWWKLKSVG